MRRSLSLRAPDLVLRVVFGALLFEEWARYVRGAYNSGLKLTHWYLDMEEEEDAVSSSTDDDESAFDEMSDEDDDPEGYACLRCQGKIAIDLLASPEIDSPGPQWFRLESGILVQSDEGSDELLGIYCARCAAEGVPRCRFGGGTEGHACEAAAPGSRRGKRVRLRIPRFGNT